MAALPEIVAEKLPIAVYAIEDNRFVYINEKLAETLGYTESELLALESSLDLVAPEQREVVEDIVRWRATGPPQEVRYLAAVRRRDGVVLDAEIHGSAVEVSGKRVLLGAAVDVSAHHGLTRKVMDREEYFRALTNDISDVVVITDPLGTIVYLSASVERRLGSQWSSWIDEKLVDRMHPEDRERFSSFFGNLLSAGSACLSCISGCLHRRGVAPEEFRVRHENGTWCFLEIAATNLLSHPQVHGVVFNMRDVTMRKRAERAALQTERLSSLGRAASQVAHEFQNALQGIQWNTDVLRKLTPEDTPMRRAVESIAVSLARSRQIVSDILEFGKPMQLDLQLIRAGDLVQQTFDEVSPALPPNISFQLDRSPTPPFRGDSARLIQVLVNLALNARDAMAAAGGALTIATSFDGQSIHFIVRDTGEGVPPELLHTIFEPHFTTKKKGSGLGLSIVHQIVSAHAGHIYVDSVMGEGTTFDVTIPAQIREVAGDATGRK